MDAAIGIRRKGPPPAVVITLIPEERAALEHLCRAGTTERRLADRAQVVLLAVLGWGNMAIAAYLDRSRYWVVRWRRRFAREFHLVIHPADDASVVPSTDFSNGALDHA